MRILTVTHFFEQHGGGIERVAGHLTREFQAAGHQPVWAASGLPGDLLFAVSLPSWNGIERATGLPMPIPGARALARLWRAVGKSDGVVIHDALYVTSIAAMFAARLRKKPAILIQHVGEIPFRSRILRSLVTFANRVVARAMLTAADRAVFISATTMAYFAKLRFGSKPCLLFNGVDPKIFRPATDLRPALRTRLGLPPEGQVILFVGRFVEKKGLATIAALARIRPDLLFVLIGKGPIDPHSWKLDNVQVAGELSGTQLAEMYGAADRLFLPSVGEGFPLVIQEAMACGLPVICGTQSAAADPGAARFLQALAVDPEQPDANARKAAGIIDAAGLSSADRMEMVDYAHRTYRWSAMSTAIIAMLLEAGATDGAPRVG